MAHFMEMQLVAIPAQYILIGHYHLQDAGAACSATESNKYQL